MNLKKIHFHFILKPCYKWIAFKFKYKGISVLLGMYYFKPCYKWTTFNTMHGLWLCCKRDNVLNLVLIGIPSILFLLEGTIKKAKFQTLLKVEYLQYPKVSINFGTWVGSFKPCYKWNTFNTERIYYR